MKTEITDAQLKNLCADIAELTDNNQHTQAKKIVCGLLGYDDLHSILCEVEKQHDKTGYLTNEMGAIRRKIGEVMLRNIQSDYCSRVYESIKNAY